MFDQGLCLFADTSQDYPLEQSVEKCLEIIEAKPFSRDFDGQLDAAEELYGVQLRFLFYDYRGGTGTGADESVLSGTGLPSCKTVNRKADPKILLFNRVSREAAFGYGILGGGARLREDSL